MHHDIALGQAEAVNQDRRQYVVEIAAAVAEGIKASAAKNNVRQTADFVNGMIFAGLLLEKGSKGTLPRFSEAFRERLPEFRSIIERGAFPDADLVMARMARHSLGINDMTPGEMLITVGLSAEGVIKEIGEEQGLSRSECLDVVIFTIALAIAANARSGSLDTLFEAVLKSVDEKADLWDEIMPSAEEVRGPKPH